MSLLAPETTPAPHLRYDWLHAGPAERDRTAYLALRREAEYADRLDARRAAEIRTEMTRLVVVKGHGLSPNLVTTQGLNDLINKYFLGSAYTAAWYMILAGTGTIATSDTLASHPGWAEVTPYTGNRPAISWGSTSAGSNTASPVTFTITSSATVAGAGICSVNTGTSGILYSASDFAGPRTVANGDTLTVTPTVSFS